MRCTLTKSRIVRGATDLTFPILILWKTVYILKRNLVLQLGHLDDPIYFHLWKRELHEGHIHRLLHLVHEEFCRIDIRIGLEELHLDSSFRLRHQVVSFLRHQFHLLWVLVVDVLCFTHRCHQNRYRISAIRVRAHHNSIFIELDFFQVLPHQLPISMRLFFVKQIQTWFKHGNPSQVVSQKQSRDFRIKLL